MENDWFQDLLMGKNPLDSITEETLNALFMGLSEHDKRQIEDNVDELSNQHRRLIHDRYQDSIKFKMKEVKEMMYALHIMKK